MRANSSSTSEVPMPTRTPPISAHGDVPFEPTAMNAPTTSRNTPGTAWCTCTPPSDTLFLNGPRPARINRVMTRVATNVATKAVKHRSNGSRPLSMMFSWNQSITVLSLMLASDNSFALAAPVRRWNRVGSAAGRWIGPLGDLPEDVGVVLPDLLEAESGGLLFGERRLDVVAVAAHGVPVAALDHHRDAVALDGPAARVQVHRPGLEEHDDVAGVGVRLDGAEQLLRGRRVGTPLHHLVLAVVVEGVLRGQPSPAGDEADHEAGAEEHEQDDQRDECQQIAALAERLHHDGQSDQRE